MTTEQENKINNMSHFQLCEMWRFAKSGEPLLQGDAGDHFSNRLFKHFGGFTPKISKQIGW